MTLQPLTGLRVVEFGHSIPGPYAGMLLGDFGAEVTKIERPGGDPWRADPSYRLFNRGKTILELDLKSPAGRDRAWTEIDRADVLIENFRPGVLDRLGLGHAAVAARRPGLIYVSISGYGSTGPLAGEPGWDSLVAARAGTPDDQGGTGRPTWVTQPVGAYGSALLAVYGTLAALYDRHRTGRGAQVETSLLAAATAFNASLLVEAPGLPRRRSASPQGSSALYRLYRCADDRWFFLAIGNPVFVFKLAQAIDYWDLITRPDLAGAPWGIAPELHVEIADHLQSIFIQRPREEWLALLDANDVPNAPVLSAIEYLDDPQARHNGVFAETENPKLGRVREVGRLIDFRPIAAAVGTPAPAQATPEAPERTGRGPLAGLRVLDLSGYIAGSFGPRLLADLGADVVKVEALDGDPFRQIGAGFLVWNFGKRSLAIDLKRPEAAPVARRLIAWADAIVENFRPGVSGRLGVDAETAAAINPAIVYCSVPGFGSSGPAAQKPAFDPLLQAKSGAMAKQGGRGQPPVFLRPAISDYAAGILNAIGVLAGLYDRDRTGRPIGIETSLTNSVVAMQVADFVEYAGRPARIDGGHEVLGPFALTRIYQTADGWLQVVCHSPEPARRLAETLNAPGAPPAGDPAWTRGLKTRDDRLEAALEAAFRTRSTGDWLAGLVAAGVPAAPLVTHSEILDDPDNRAPGLLITFEHPDHGRVRQAGAFVRVDGGPAGPPRPSPGLGTDADTVLTEVGLSPAEIAALRQSRTIL